jgi:hypothetical protein
MDRNEEISYILAGRCIPVYHLLQNMNRKYKAKIKKC